MYNGDVLGGGVWWCWWWWLQVSVMLSDSSVTCSVVFLNFIARYLELLKHVLTQVGM